MESTSLKTKVSGSFLLVVGMFVLLCFYQIYTMSKLAEFQDVGASR